MIVHHCLLIHWNLLAFSTYGANNLALWGYAVKHVVWLHSCIPNHLSGLTPLELLTKTKTNHCDLLWTHVWGCTVYVLDLKLQDGQKISKWNCTSHLGQFLGFSDVHSSLVVHVWYLSTGYVLPQYHLVFDDLFETVFNTGNYALIYDIYNHLFGFDCNFYFYDNVFTSEDPLVYHLPPLDSWWSMAEWTWVLFLLLWSWKIWSTGW